MVQKGKCSICGAVTPWFAKTEQDVDKSYFHLVNCYLFDLGINYNIALDSTDFSSWHVKQNEGPAISMCRWNLRKFAVSDPGHYKSSWLSFSYAFWIFTNSIHLEGGETVRDSYDHIVDVPSEHSRFRVRVEPHTTWFRRRRGWRFIIDRQLVIPEHTLGKWFVDGKRGLYDSHEAAHAAGLAALQGKKGS